MWKKTRSDKWIPIKQTFNLDASQFIKDFRERKTITISLLFRGRKIVLKITKFNSITDPRIEIFARYQLWLRQFADLSHNLSHAFYVFLFLFAVTCRTRLESLARACQSPAPSLCSASLLISRSLSDWFSLFFRASLCDDRGSFLCDTQPARSNQFTSDLNIENFNV